MLLVYSPWFKACLVCYWKTCLLQACTVDGTVYDLSNIVPYIQKFHKHPVTGAELHLRDVIQLTFHKNAEGEYHDPVLNKVFTEHTHIVAIKTTGNVYAYEVWSSTTYRSLLLLRRAASKPDSTMCVTSVV